MTVGDLCPRSGEGRAMRRRMPAFVIWILLGLVVSLVPLACGGGGSEPDAGHAADGQVSPITGG